MSSSSTAQESMSSQNAGQMQHEVCIVGADEYVGQLMVKEYLNRKARVVAFLPEKSEWTTQIELTDMGATVVPGSLDTLPQHVQHVNTIVCTLGVRYSAVIADHGIKWDDHRVALQRVFDIATNTNISRLIMIATMEGPFTKSWLPLSKAKEAAISEIKKRLNLNKINFTVIRPGLLFRDVTSILPGLGNCIVGKLNTGRRRQAVQNNPIHEADLAYFVAECTNDKRYFNCEVNVGGPDVINTQELYCKMLAARDPNMNLISMLQQSRYRAPKHLDRWLKYIFNQDMLGMRYGYRSLNDTLHSMQIRELITKDTPANQLEDIFGYPKQLINTNPFLKETPQQNIDSNPYQSHFTASNPFVLLTQDHEAENQYYSQNSEEKKVEERERESVQLKEQQKAEFEKQNLNVNIYGSGSVVIVENCEFYTPTSTGDIREIIDLQQQQELYEQQEDQGTFSNEQSDVKQDEEKDQNLPANDKEVDNGEQEISFRQSLIVPEVENVQSKHITQIIEPQNQQVQDVQDTQYAEQEEKGTTSTSFHGIQLDSGKDQNIVVCLDNKQNRIRIDVKGTDSQNTNVLDAENVGQHVGTIATDEIEPQNENQDQNQLSNQNSDKNVQKIDSNDENKAFEQECIKCYTCTDDVLQQDDSISSQEKQSDKNQQIQNAQYEGNAAVGEKCLVEQQTEQQFQLKVSREQKEKQQEAARNILDAFINQIEATDEISQEINQQSREATQEATRIQGDSALIQQTGEAAGEACRDNTSTAGKPSEASKGTDSSTDFSTMNFNALQVKKVKQQIPENIRKFYRSRSDTRSRSKASMQNLSEIHGKESKRGSSTVPENMRKYYRSQSDTRHSTSHFKEDSPQIFSVSSLGRKYGQQQQGEKVGGLTQFKRCLEEGYSSKELFQNQKQQQQQQKLNQQQTKQEEQQQQSESGGKESLSPKGLKEYWQKKIEMEQSESEGKSSVHQEQIEE